MTDKIVRTWKASPEDRAVITAISKANKKARIVQTESDMIRAGLRLLAKDKGVDVE